MNVGRFWWLSFVTVEEELESLYAENYRHFQ
jgi:hypothetical protein